MSSGRGDLRERLPIETVRERAGDVRERATEFYERTVASSDDASEHGAARRGDAGVSESTGGRFRLSNWLGSNPVGQPDGGELSAVDSDRADESSTAGEGSSGDDASRTESTDTGAQFDFRGWLAEGGDDVAALDGTATETVEASAASEPTRSSAETTAAESSAAEPAGFDFVAWVRTGDTDLDPIRDPTGSDEEPVEADEELAEPSVDATDAVEATVSIESASVADSVEGGAQPAGAAGFDRVGAPSSVSVLEIHPVKAATLALFLAFVALAALSMGGYLPPLGPSTGLAF